MSGAKNTSHRLTKFTYIAGKRVCMGEQQAKAVQFLFISNILQNFHLTFPADQPNPSLDHVYAGMAIGPQPFRLMMKPRDQM